MVEYIENFDKESHKNKIDTAPPKSKGCAPIDGCHMGHRYWGTKSRRNLVGCVLLRHEGFPSRAVSTQGGPST